jgi:hypothetical protein
MSAAPRAVWLAGTDETFDPEATVPAPMASDVIHDGGKVHGPR